MRWCAEQREVGRLVEEPLMDCHSPERAASWRPGRWSIPMKLRQGDRCDLDDAVLELLGGFGPEGAR